MKRHADFQKYNVFRRPDWRFERVIELCDRFPAPGRASRRDDRYVKAARSFLLRWRARDGDSEREELFWENPGLFYAFQIHERAGEEPEPAHFLQARLLARQTPAEVAACLSTCPEAVEWYEALFFNVTDRLDNRDWITKQVLLPAILRNHGITPDPKGDEPPVDPAAAALFRKAAPVALPFLDASLKLFAFFGGKYLVDVMITGFEAGKPLQSPEQMTQWFDAHWATTIRRRSHQAALQFEINKYNVMELFAIHTRIKEIEKAEDSDGRRRSLIETHTRALLDDLPWAAGEAAERSIAGTPLEPYDGYAAELRDDELLQTAAGATLPGLREAVAPLSLPPPRRKDAAARRDEVL